MNACQYARFFIFIFITSNIYMKLTASDLQWCNLVLHILKCMAQSLLFHYSGDSQQCFILAAFSQMIFPLKKKSMNATTVFIQ